MRHLQAEQKLSVVPRTCISSLCSFGYPIIAVLRRMLRRKSGDTPTPPRLPRGRKRTAASVSSSSHHLFCEFLSANRALPLVPLLFRFVFYERVRGAYAALFAISQISGHITSSQGANRGRKSSHRRRWSNKKKYGASAKIYLDNDWSRNAEKATSPAHIAPTTPFHGDGKKENAATGTARPAMIWSKPRVCGVIIVFLLLILNFLTR